jgi:hypothetical protein
MHAIVADKKLKKGILINLHDQLAHTKPGINAWWANKASKIIISLSLTLTLNIARKKLKMEN